MAKAQGNEKKLSAKDKLEEEKKIYIGAIPLNSHIKIKLGNELVICQIKDIRHISQINKDENPNEYSYEYYIHYINYDRRNDHWIPRKEILETKVSDIEVKKLNNNNEENIIDNDENVGMDKPAILAHEEATKVRTVEEIVMGNYRCYTWYFSPFPEEYHNVKTLFFCEFCLNFYVKKEELERHLLTNCQLRHPPGNEIYRDDKISMFEVDGKAETIYCENLSYLAKLFLDHKNLEWELDIFLFYILTEYDKYGYHFVGMFSKVKDSPKCNLACILTLPFHQRKGYGKFLIDFSYLLSKREQKFGTPERPLSDLGFKTYFAYWAQKIIETLKNWKGNTITINDISQQTQIKQEDIHKVMTDLKLLTYDEKRNYVIVGDKKILDELEKRTGKKGYPLHPEKLIWSPFITKI